MVRAYVLVQTDVGRGEAVARELATLDGVLASDFVIGPYDVVVHVEAASIDELGRLLMTRVQAVPGITRTLTCSVAHL